MDGQNWEVIWGGEHFPTPEPGQLGLGIPYVMEAYRRLRRLKFGIYALVDSLVSSDSEGWDGEYTSEGLVLCSYKGDGRKEEFLTATVTLG